LTTEIIKRSVVIGGHKTSVSLEDEFWSALKDIAAARRASLSELVSEIDKGRDGGNLSSAIRLHVLRHYRARALETTPASA
jgi:predicted DNA-binding ribbon-helix-helix protein